MLKKLQKTITQQQVKKLFTYEPFTGKLIRIKTLSGNSKTGTIVGTRRKDNYLCVIVYGKPYLVHRIIWLLLYGRFPESIDHINHIRNDNRLCNLREVTHKENTYNQSIRTNNKSGAVGVMFDGSRNKWRAYIMVDGVQRFLGRFKQKQDAIKARKEANLHYGFHENHGGLR